MEKPAYRKTTQNNPYDPERPTIVKGGRSLFSWQRILPLDRFRFTEKGPTGIVTSKPFEVVLGSVLIATEVKVLSLCLV